MLNMLMLEGRIAEIPDDLTAPVPSGEGAA
jgi:hypothetical protein